MENGIVGTKWDVKTYLQNIQNLLNDIKRYNDWSPLFLSSLTKYIKKYNMI